MSDDDGEEFFGPGDAWDPVTGSVVQNPAFAARRPRMSKASREELFFRQVIYAAESQARQGVPVNLATIRGANPDLPERATAELIASEKFADAMEARGIPWSPTQALTPQQLDAITLYLDTSVPLSHGQKLKKIGVSEARWRMWLAQPEFYNRISVLSEQSLATLTPVALTRLAEAVDKGEQWAIRFALEVNGRHDPRMPGVNVEAVLLGIFNILEEEVADERVLRRIGAVLEEALPTLTALSSAPSGRRAPGHDTIQVLEAPAT